MTDILTAVLLLSPLIGALINGFFWQSRHLKFSGFIGNLACFISFASAGALFFLPLKSFSVNFFHWIHIADLKINFSFLIDPLSQLMLLVVTGVGFLIHLFSIYYMSDDNRPAKYFSYLNLFIFSMIILILGDNLFLMFLGWEGVGLCSYLLIGFWFTDKQKASAGMKAFIVNRIGDIGFLLGMLLLAVHFNTLEFKELAEVLPFQTELVPISLISLCLFLGAVGKSAQIPLYIWLPTAMAGPTPVSALIHAATMVTAGVYLILRMNFLFILTPDVLTLISWIGALTALLAGLIASAQTDIKKVLAYSTVSQLGYMFLAVGITAFSAGLFHLITHAFFKALLFLGAGAVIHSLSGEQNIYKMGGLKSKMPWTYTVFLIGFLSLIGFPFFSGFFSKDEILWSAFAGGHFFLLALALITAGFTAFYMTRLFVLIFHGKNRTSLNPHDTGWIGNTPLMILAVLSLFAGLLGLPHLMDQWTGGHWIKNYLGDLISQPEFKGTVSQEISLMAGTSFLILTTATVTAYLYLKKSVWLSAFKNKNIKIFNGLNQALKVDDFFHKTLVKPCLQVSRELWREVDEKGLQGFIFFIQKGALRLKDFFMLLQNGKWQNYIFFITLALAVCIINALTG